MIKFIKKAVNVLSFGNRLSFKLEYKREIITLYFNVPARCLQSGLLKVRTKSTRFISMRENFILEKTRSLFKHLSLWRLWLLCGPLCHFSEKRLHLTLQLKSDSVAVVTCYNQSTNMRGGGALFEFLNVDCNKCHH